MRMVNGKSGLRERTARSCPRLGRPHPARAFVVLASEALLLRLRHPRAEQERKRTAETRGSMPEQRGRPPALQTMRQNTRSFCTSGTLPRFHGHGSSGRAPLRCACPWMTKGRGPRRRASCRFRDEAKRKPEDRHPFRDIEGFFSDTRAMPSPHSEPSACFRIATDWIPDRPPSLRSGCLPG
jgi:hypothetical protein